MINLFEENLDLKVKEDEVVAGIIPYVVVLVVLLCIPKQAE
ncbi:MAG TPA: hypothetical protein PLI27_11020 [Ignavibacteriales bacterium]|jgi:hypothetical protein|nr:hypothetical protein [Ignavibacteriales bacterium]